MKAQTTRLPPLLAVLCAALLWLTTPLFAPPRAPAYMVAGNRALGQALSAASFGYMPVHNALRDGASDPQLCFYTATYQDKLLSLFNLLADVLPEKGKARPGETKRVEAIRKTLWRIKRGALALEYYCGLGNSWPPEWRVNRVRPGDRPAFEKRFADIEAALEELKKLIY